MLISTSFVFGDEKSFEDFVIEVSQQVDLFSDTWAQDPEARFSGDVTTEFIYSLLKDFNNGVNEAKFKRSRILISDIVKESSNLNYFSADEDLDASFDNYGPYKSQSLKEESTQSKNFSLTQNSINLSFLTSEDFIKGNISLDQFKKDSDLNLKEAIEFLNFIARDHHYRYGRYKESAVALGDREELIGFFSNEISISNKEVKNLKAYFSSEEDYRSFLQGFGVDLDNLDSSSSTKSVESSALTEIQEAFRNAKSPDDIYEYVRVYGMSGLTNDQILSLSDEIKIELDNKSLVHYLRYQTNNLKFIYLLSLWANKNGLLSDLVFHINSNFIEAERVTAISLLAKLVLIDHLPQQSIEALMVSDASYKIIEALSPAFLKENGLDLFFRVFQYHNIQVQKKISLAFLRLSSSLKGDFDLSKDMLERALNEKVDPSIKVVLVGALINIGVPFESVKNLVYEIITTNPRLFFRFESLYSGYIRSSFDGDYIAKVYQLAEIFLQEIDLKDFSDKTDADDQLNALLIAVRIITSPKDLIHLLEKFDNSKLLELSADKSAMLLKIFNKMAFLFGRNENLLIKWKPFFVKQPESFIDVLRASLKHFPAKYLIEVISQPVVNMGFAEQLLNDKSPDVRILAWIHYLRDEETRKNIKLSSLIEMLKSLQFISQNAVGYEWSHLSARFYFDRSEYAYFIEEILKSVGSLKDHLQKEQIANALSEIKISHDKSNSEEVIRVEKMRLETIRSLTDQESFNRILEKMFNSSSFTLGTKTVISKDLVSQDPEKSQAIAQKIFNQCTYGSRLADRIMKAIKRNGPDEKTTLECLLENKYEKIHLLISLGYKTEQFSKLLMSLFSRKYDEFAYIPEKVIINWIITSEKNHFELERGRSIEAPKETYTKALKDKIVSRLKTTLARAPSLEMKLYMSVFPEDLDVVLESLYVHRRAGELWSQLLQVIVSAAKDNHAILKNLSKAQKARKAPISINGVRLEKWLINKLELNNKCVFILKEKM